MITECSMVPGTKVDGYGNPYEVTVSFKFVSSNPTTALPMNDEEKKLVEQLKNMMFREVEG